MLGPGEAKPEADDIASEQARLDAENAELRQRIAEQKAAADAEIAEAYKSVTEEDIQDMLDEKDITPAEAEEMRGYVALAQEAQADAPENQESERPKYGVDTSVWEVLDDLDPHGVYGGKTALQQSLGSSLFEYANPDGSISPDDVQNVLDDAGMALALRIAPSFQPPGLYDKMQELLKLYTEMHPG